MTSERKIKEEANTSDCVYGKCHGNLSLPCHYFTLSNFFSVLLRYFFFLTLLLFLNRWMYQWATAWDWNVIILVINWGDFSASKGHDSVVKLHSFENIWALRMIKKIYHCEIMFLLKFFDCLIKFLNFHSKVSDEYSFNHKAKITPLNDNLQKVEPTYRRKDVVLQLFQLLWLNVPFGRWSLGEFL